MKIFCNQPVTRAMENWRLMRLVSCQADCGTKGNVVVCWQTSIAVQKRWIWSFGASELIWNWLAGRKSIFISLRDLKFPTDTHHQVFSTKFMSKQITNRIPRVKQISLICGIMFLEVWRDGGCRLVVAPLPQSQHYKTKPYKKVKQNSKNTCFHKKMK